MAKVSLHFGKSILDLDPDEVNAFLFHLAKEKKAIDLNKAKLDLGQPLWGKTTFSWKEIALAKLNINPDACPNCKKGFMEVVDCFLSLRGPPLLKMRRNTQFLDSWWLRCNTTILRIPTCFGLFLIKGACCGVLHSKRYPPDQLHPLIFQLTEAR